MQVSPATLSPRPLPGSSQADAAIGDPDTDRRVVLLESSLRILREQPYLGDAYQKAEWKRQLEQDRAALRGLGRMPA